MTTQPKFTNSYDDYKNNGKVVSEGFFEYPPGKIKFRFEYQVETNEFDFQIDDSYNRQQEQRVKDSFMQDIKDGLLKEKNPRKQKDYFHL